MDRDSTFELVTEEEKVPVKIEKINGRSRRHCCLMICLVATIVIFVCSFFLLLIMIPISIQIEDKAAVDATLLRLNTSFIDSSVKVILAKVDALWHWEVEAGTSDLMVNETLSLSIVLESELSHIWINFTTSDFEDTVVYCLAGSIISSVGTFSVVYEDIQVCVNCSTYHVVDRGYYHVQSSSGGNVRYCIRGLNNSIDSACKLEAGLGTDHCELIFDKISPYYVIANVQSPFNTDEGVIVVQLSENGRRTWYILIVLLVLPIMFSTVAMVITIVCMIMKRS